MSSESFMLARAATTASPAAAIRPLTSDVAIQYILADIPFYTVGVFALGAFTFSVVVRKFNWLMLCLFASVWLAFAGAILDLVACLALSRGESLSTGTNLALTIAREIAYSLSFGLRFLWFWLFVGCPPPATSTLPANTHMHSGSWQRWGIFGHLLRWIVLLSVLGIVSLQMVYRVYTPLNSDGPVYDAEATLQIVLSFVFILKLFMNIYLVALDFPKEPLWSRNLLRYLPIFMALLINFGIGLGNLLQFIFSETVLGRFLQAIELYILILATLILTFCHLRDAPANSTSSARHKRTSSFNNIPAGATMTPELILPHPRLTQTDLISAFQRQLAPDGGNRRSLNRQSSYASRVSNWIGRRMSQRNDIRHTERDKDDLLWKQNKEEQGNPVDIEVKIPAPYDPSPMESEPSPSYRMPPQVYAMPDVNIPSRKGILAPGGQKITTTVSVPKRARIRFSDGGSQTVAVDPPTPQYNQARTESPIYGLNGVVNARNAASTVARPASGVDDDPRALFDDSPRSSGISNLLRQQEELDKSIAALKLFSNDPSEAASARRSLSVFSDGPRASSIRSIESLSNFPEPPWGRNSMASMPLKTQRMSVETIRPSPLGLLPSSSSPSLATGGPSQVVPTLNVPGHRVQPSVPWSETSDLMGSEGNGRLNPAGMEITSFIGHLTHPGHVATGSTGTLTVDTAVVTSQGRLEAIKESPRTPQQPANAPNARSRLAADTSLLSPFPVSPTDWARASEGDVTASVSISPSVSAVVGLAPDTSVAQLQSVPQRRPMGLPSGPRLSPFRTRSESERASDATVRSATPF